MTAFVDAHVHFWDHSAEGLDWAWLRAGFEHPRLKEMHNIDAPRFTGPELRAEAGDASPVAVVHVQSAGAGAPAERESAWLEEMAANDAHGWPNAIVGRCRLREPEAEGELRRHSWFPNVRGIRDMSITEPVDPSDVAVALDTAAELRLSIELLVSYEAFPSVHALATRWPDVTFVLGHAGLPVERTDPYFTRWHDALARLAEAPNVVCKVSALASGADPHWSVDSIRPWVLGCIDAFGADRCMLASNWPIDRLHGRYPDLVAAYDVITSSLGDEARRQVFSETARRVYRMTR